MAEIRQLEDVSEQLPGDAVKGVERNSESQMGEERHVAENMFVRVLREWIGDVSAQPVAVDQCRRSGL